MEQARERESTGERAQASRLMRVLRGEALEVPPVWMMRQAGRYLPEYQRVRAQAGSFLDLCYTPELACEVTLQPIRRYGFDAAILFADILLVPDGLGQKVTFEEGVGPVLEPVDSAAALAKLGTDGLHDHLAPVYETVRLVREALAREVALIGFCGAPWTVVSYMVGGRGSPDQKAARLAAYSGAPWFGELVELVTRASVDYLCRQVAAGADALQIFDTWAGNLPAREFERWCVAPTRAIVDGVRAEHPQVPIIGFPRGCGAGYVDYAARTGVDAVGLDSTVDARWAARALAPELPLQGNLDPLALVAGGAALEQAVGDILSAFSRRAHVFNLGHGIVPETPLEHVARAVELVRSGEQGGRGRG